MKRAQKYRYDIDEQGKHTIFLDRRRIAILDVNTHIVQFANQHYFQTLEDLGLDYSIDLSIRTNARLYKNSVILSIITLLNEFKFGSPNPYFFVNCSGLGEHQLTILNTCFKLLGIDYISYESDLQTLFDKLSSKDVDTTTMVIVHIHNNDLNTSSSIKIMKKKAKQQGLTLISDQILQDSDNQVIFN